MIKKFLFFIFGFIVGIFFFTPFNISTTSLHKFKSIKYYDINNQVFFTELIDDYGYHEFIKLSQIPLFIQDAVIKLEDKRFYYHFGFDPIATIRSSWQNFSASRIVSGGSGITQQLVRYHSHPKKRDLLYKLQELIIAIKVEFYYSKAEILEAYLNSIYFGNNAYGIASASKEYFNKNPNELTLREAVFLVGLPQSPSVYNPYKNLKLALEREKNVITTLTKNNFFSTYCHNKNCLTTSLNFKTGKIEKTAPHYIEELKKELSSQIPNNLLNNKNSQDVEIYTYLDKFLYYQVESIIKQQIELNEDKNISNAATVILNHANKGISVLIGSADYYNTKIQGFVNNAVSLRQAGSTIKPFTYALAFEQGDTPDSIVNDSFLHLKTQDGLPYEPKNYDFKEYGTVSYRQALANSYNISAIKIAQKVGVKNLLNTLRSLGFSSLNLGADNYGVALTLGDGEVRLLDLTSAYSVFPQNGQKYNYHYIREIKVNNQTIYSRNQEKSANIFTVQTTDFIKDILSDNQARLQQFGDESPLKTSTWSGAKTGTTRNYRDNWTVGFNHDFTVGVWVGNANGAYLKKSSGVSGAGPIWHDIMESLPQKKVIPFKKKYTSSTQLKPVSTIANKNLIDNNNNVISPQNGDIFLLEGLNQEAIILKSKQDYDWWIDEEYIGYGKKLFWEKMVLGKHCATVKNKDKTIVKNCFLIQ